MKNFDYTQTDISSSLRNIGIKNGDSLFVHSNIGFFGKLKEGNNRDAFWRIFKNAIFEVVRKTGTLVVPTFTYSFCWNKIYDKEKTPSTAGLLSEFVRNDPESLRTDDANFSVAAIGKNAKLLTDKMPEHSFGKNSFWERFLSLNGKICCFNVGLEYNTFIHYVEKKFNVPYRYDKKFLGKSLINGKLENGCYVHFVRDLDNPDTFPDLTIFVEIANKFGVIRETKLGRGKISCISAKDSFSIIKREIKKNPNLLIKGKYT